MTNGPMITPPPDPTPPLATPQKPIYDFKHLGVGISRAMIQAAEANLNEAQTRLQEVTLLSRTMIEAQETNVTEAQNKLQEVLVLADSITQQVEEENRKANELHERLKEFAATVLNAHRKYNGSNNTEG